MRRNHIFKTNRILALRVDRVMEPVGVLYFGSAPDLEDTLITELAAHPDSTRLILDLRKVGRIDYSGAATLRRVVTRAETTGLQVEMISGDPPQGERILNLVFNAKNKCIKKIG